MLDSGRMSSISAHRTDAAKPAVSVYSQLHVVPQGGSLAVECAHGTYVNRVSFASFGTPSVAPNGTAVIGTCHSRFSHNVVSDACLGNSHCCLPVTTDNFHDPCRGTIKTLVVRLEGCAEHTSYTSYKRHCSLLGQSLVGPALM